jgi:hypothetical protein
MADDVVVSSSSSYLWGGPAGIRLKHAALAGIVILAVLNAADAVTTNLVLRSLPVGTKEANPLANVLLAGGTPRLLLTKMIIIALLGTSIIRHRPRLGITIGVWLVCGFYLTAVVSNVLILRLT